MIPKKINNTVSVKETHSEYPTPPFIHAGSYQEALLDLLEGLGLNRANPFNSYIKPGQMVLVKPNWVRESNPLGYPLDSLVTHSSLIKYVIDLLAKAMEGRGTIVIADAPLQKTNFDKLKNATGINSVVSKAREDYPNLKIIIEDWRITTLKDYKTNSQNLQESRLQVDGLPGNDYKVFDLGEDSFLEEISEYAERFRVTNYPPSLMTRHHAYGKHEYVVSNRIFEADFIVNLPKLKTHMKAGVTCALKNLIGINGHKEFLPHHIKGSYFEGGDNYLMPNRLRAKYEDLYDCVWEDINRFSVRRRKLMMRLLKYLLTLSEWFGKESIRAGSWRGNDTVWRTTLDLNHIAYFHTKARVLNIVDGIVAGEGEGPMKPSPKPLGILVAGENPAYVDAVVTKILGYNISRVPSVYHAVTHRRSKFAGPCLEEVTVNYLGTDSSKLVSFRDLPNHKFKKPPFWGGA